MSFKDVNIDTKTSTPTKQDAISIPWSPSSGYTGPELQLIILLLQAVEGDLWGCRACGVEYDCSAELLTHVLGQRACGGDLVDVGFENAQYITVLAAVDWKGTKELVESYVGMWERGELSCSSPLSTSSESDSDTSSQTASPYFTPSKSPAPPRTDRKPKTKTDLDANTTNDLPSIPHPTSRKRFCGSKKGKAALDLDPYTVKSASDVLPSGARANVYNANENVYVFLDAGFPGTMEDLLMEACFPLEPPGYLVGNARGDYLTAMARLKKWSAHRMPYLKPNGLHIADKPKLIADWNRKYANGTKGYYKNIESWSSRRSHDMQRLRNLLIPRSSAATQDSPVVGTSEGRSSDCELDSVLEESRYEQPEPQLSTEAGIASADIITEKPAPEAVYGHNVIDLTEEAAPEVIVIDSDEAEDGGEDEDVVL